MSKKSTKSPSALLVEELDQTLQRLVEADKTALSLHQHRRLRSEIGVVAQRIGKLMTDLDPVRHPVSVFNPNNPRIMGGFISLALVSQDRHPLNEIGRFYGAGVYAIYYNGAFPLYEKIARTETPIYVGKAEPKDYNAETPIQQGKKLCDRLDEHGKSISGAVDTLKIEDFEFRALVVQSGLAASAEAYLIRLFKPIWNKETKIISGIGKHGDKATTRANKRSTWDILHPSREWAAESAVGDKTPETIQAEVEHHLSTHPIYTNLQDVINGFVRELSQSRPTA